MLYFEVRLKDESNKSPLITPRLEDIRLFKTPTCRQPADQGGSKMFVGHYGPSLAAKALNGSVPLWALFLAVQLVDVFWAIFVLLGIEKVRIAPGITATNPLDLYYMPYTHSLVAAILWSVATALV
jgi:hypothetical protein